MKLFLERIRGCNVIVPMYFRQNFLDGVSFNWCNPGNGNRGGRGGIFGIPPPWPKIFRKYPPLEILGKFFEKPGKTEKIR